MKNDKPATSAHTCWECGAPMVFRNYTHTEKVGRHKVADATRLAWQCPAARCGEVDVSLDELGSYERRAAAVVLREVRRIDGAVYRYARKALGLPQAVLAELLGCAPETLSRWENDAAAMPRATELALVALLDGVDLCGGSVEALVAREQGRSAGGELEVPGLRGTG